MRFACVALLLTSSCQKGAHEEPPDPPRAGPTGAAYRADVERLCGALTLSGADQRPPAERVAATAQWLGANIETEAGVDFMIAFKQAPSPADALRAEARRLGLPGCALADSW